MSNEDLYQKAMALASKGDAKAAISLYKEISKSSNDPRHLIAYGVCLQRLGHWKQSIVPLQRGISLKPHYGEADARLFLAKAYLESGKKRLALEQWQAVAKMQPEYPSYEAAQNEAKKMLAQHA